ncbi:leucine carboxyl methyltransferase [Linderina pennispora]|uniref:Leucine carboxyl methyltransferase 1 n=1 Tax=Linderina pennispora TaxID=61395 RepID=A0A1Y1WH27_9FUNG|nr:leucine carboxyl methyltransferase [Linderina pennispora]ORX72424.1 leucine carboxyl methyltransferase [Linderina pennispora]
MPVTESSDDAIVQGTSNDAAVSRESAARLGYMADRYIHNFVRQPQRRPPLINRGTYCRFHGIQSALRQFTESEAEPKQVVVLGAGLDTAYFILKSEGLLNNVRYFETDFEEITAKKASTVYRKRELKALLPPDIKVARGGAELHSPSYNLLAGDLRAFEAQVVPKLMERGFQTDVPTLFISECVLIYLDPKYSDRILDWATDNVLNCGIITYEQILPGDRFGKMMIENLRARGLELRGLHAHPTLESMEKRFSGRGWQFSKAVDLVDYHDQCVEKNELDRIARIEFLDEWEEFTLLAQHYAFTFAYRTSSLPFSAMHIV